MEHPILLVHFCIRMLGRALEWWFGQSFLSKSCFHRKPSLASPQTGMWTVREQAVLEAS